MSNKTCKDCLHCSVDDGNAFCTDMPWHYPFGGSDLVALDKEACKHFLERNKPTVFDQITASPEVLAPNFVYHVTSFLDGLDKPKKIWYSTLIHNKSFKTELEAKRATAAKLKEVKDV